MHLEQKARHCLDQYRLNDTEASQADQAGAEQGIVTNDCRPEFDAILPSVAGVAGGFDPQVPVGIRDQLEPTTWPWMAGAQPPTHGAGAHRTDERLTIGRARCREGTPSGSRYMLS